MLCFRFLTTLLCLGLMMGANSAEDTQSPNLEQQKKVAGNNSSSPSDPDIIVVASPPAQNHTSNQPFSIIPNKDALIRSSYVFGGLCFLAVLYFVFRTCRLRRRRGSGSRRTGTRKYKPLHTAGSQEMEPLGDGGDNDDEDEDTLFDTSQPSNPARPSPSLGV